VSLNGDDIFQEASGRCCPAAGAFRSTTSRRLERALAQRDVAAFIVEPIQAMACTWRADYLRERADCVASKARCSSPTKCRPASAAPGACGRWSTGTPSPT